MQDPRAYHMPAPSQSPRKEQHPDQTEPRLPLRFLVRNSTAYHRLRPLQLIREGEANGCGDSWLLQSLRYRPTQEVPPQTLSLWNHWPTPRLAIELPHTEICESRHRRGLFRIDDRWLWSPPGHCPRSHSFSMPYQRCSFFRQLPGPLVCRWLPPVPWDQHLQGPPHLTARPQTTWSMGGHLEDALQCLKMLHPQHKGEVELQLHSQQHDLKACDQQSLFRHPLLPRPEVGRPHCQDLQES